MRNFEVGQKFSVMFTEEDNPPWYWVEVKEVGRNYVCLGFDDGEEIYYSIDYLSGSSVKFSEENLQVQEETCEKEQRIAELEDRVKTLEGMLYKAAEKLYTEDDDAAYEALCMLGYE